MFKETLLSTPSEVFLLFLILLLFAVLSTTFFLRTLSRIQNKNLELLVQKEKEEKDLALHQLSLEKTNHLQTRNTLIESQKQQSIVEIKLEIEKKSLLEKVSLLKEAESTFKDSFKSLSQDALKSSQEQFLQIAHESIKIQRSQSKQEMDQRVQAVESLVKPIKESLDKTQKQTQEIEKNRQYTYGSLKQQIKDMSHAQLGLQQQTSKLVKALRQPSGRGQWGEMQLRRVVEMSGMQKHCDFSLQTSVQTDENKMLRPDLVIHLPGGQQVIVDSKAPMDAYLDAIETDDATQKSTALARHAAQVCKHIQQLSSKEYQNQFSNSPEFVVLFLPSEAFFSAALEEDTSLIEKGVNQGVIIATPTTLIALLRTVAYGWKQDALSNNAKEIAQLGKELYERLYSFNEHIHKVSRSLNSSVDSFNKAVGSFDSRVLTSAKKFELLEAAPKGRELISAPAIERHVNAPQKIAPKL